MNEEHGAAQIEGDFVYSRKPNPAFVAMDHFDAGSGPVMTSGIKQGQ